MTQSLERLLVDDPVGALCLEGPVHELHLRLRELGLLRHSVHITGLVPLDVEQNCLFRDDKKVVFVWFDLSANTYSKPCQTRDLHLACHTPGERKFTGLAPGS